MFCEVVAKKMVRVASLSKKYTCAYFNVSVCYIIVVLLTTCNAGSAQYYATRL